jgi:hypothetical protein
MDWRSALRKVCVETTLRKPALLRDGAAMDSAPVQELPKDALVRAKAYEDSANGVARASKPRLHWARRT